MTGKIDFIMRSMCNPSERIQLFAPLFKLKANQKFVWGEGQQRALDNIKIKLKSPPVLIPLKIKSRSTNEWAIRSALIQEFGGKERVVYFISRGHLDASRYLVVERLCWCLYFSCTK
jgi:hypothetical protein